MSVGVSSLGEFFFFFSFFFYAELGLILWAGIWTEILVVQLVTMVDDFGG